MGVRAISRNQGREEEGGIIGGNLNRGEKENYKKLTKGGDDYVSIDKKWLFERLLLEMHFSQSDGEGLSDIRTQ